MITYYQLCNSHLYKNYKQMNTELINELIAKISKIDHKLFLLQCKGSNDETLVDKKRALLKEYFKLTQQKNDKT